MVLFSRLVSAGLLAGLVVVSGAEAATRGDPNAPNWPCVQRKVPDLMLGSAWSGPEVDETATDWRDGGPTEELVATLVQRRVPLEEGDAAINAFIAATGADKEAKLKALFVGLYQRFNQERRDVMNGIERFAKKQVDLANNLKQRNADLDKLRNDRTTDFSVLQVKADEVLWETRVFDDRQKALTFVCEVPVIIEQRLFHFGKTISAALK